MKKNFQELYVSPTVEIIEMDEQSIICDSGQTDQYNYGGPLDGWQ